MVAIPKERKFWGVKKAEKKVTPVVIFNPSLSAKWKATNSMHSKQTHLSVGVVVPASLRLQYAWDAMDRADGEKDQHANRIIIQSVSIWGMQKVRGQKGTCVSGGDGGVGWGVGCKRSGNKWERIRLAEVRLVTYVCSSYAINLEGHNYLCETNFIKSQVRFIYVVSLSAFQEDWMEMKL